MTRKSRPKDGTKRRTLDLMTAERQTRRAGSIRRHGQFEFLDTIRIEHLADHVI